LLVNVADPLDPILILLGRICISIFQFHVGRYTHTLSIASRLYCEYCRVIVSKGKQNLSNTACLLRDVFSPGTVRTPPEKPAPICSNTFVGMGSRFRLCLTSLIASRLFLFLSMPTLEASRGISIKMLAATVVNVFAVSLVMFNLDLCSLR